MAKVTTCREAIANFEKAKGVVATEADKVSLLLLRKLSALCAVAVTRNSGGLQVELNGCCPPIEKLDPVLGSLKGCRLVLLFRLASLEPERQPASPLCFGSDGAAGEWSRQAFATHVKSSAQAPCLVHQQY